MGAPWKFLLPLLVVLPLGAFVVGSLAGTADDEPPARDPIVLRQGDSDPPLTDPARRPTQKPSDREPDDDDDDDVPVVTPLPVDDDGDPDDGDDGNDDRDDSDDDGGDGDD